MATILVVDDAAFMRGSLRHILEMGGHTVVGEAKDGIEALELYRRHRPDIVTMDVLMSEMGGLDGVKSIIEVDSTAKIIMVSALGQESMKASATALGASGYITKPFSSKDILNEVSRVLSDER